MFELLKFYRFIDNRHKLPIIRTILCKIGRHGYEFVRVFPIFQYAELECFYCAHKKNVNCEIIK